MANTPQQVVDVGAVANDGTGTALRTAFIEINNNFANIWASGPVSSNVVVRNNVISTSVTNMPLALAGNGIGNVQTYSHFVPRTDDTYDIGTSDYRFSTGYFGTGGLDVTGPSNFAGNIVAQGNISGNYLIGNGAFITGIVATAGASIDNGLSNVRIGGANANVTVSVAGTGNVAVFGNTQITFSTVLANPRTLTSNINIANNTSAMMISPVTLPNGLQITVPSGSTFSIGP